MSYRDEIRALRTELHRHEAKLLPIHIGVESAKASALLGRARAMMRAIDRLYAEVLTERLDHAAGTRPEDAVVVEVIEHAAAARHVGRLFGALGS